MFFLYSYYSASCGVDQYNIFVYVLSYAFTIRFTYKRNYFTRQQQQQKCLLDSYFTLVAGLLDKFLQCQVRHLRW